MKKNSWIVKEDDVRPARPDGTCFYCGALLGTEHNLGCVLRRKTVVVEYTFRTVSEYPEDWDADQIEGFLNVSSSCANNRLRELADRYLTDEEDEMCVCHLFEGKFVREATENDLYRHIPGYESEEDDTSS